MPLVFDPPQAWRVAKADSSSPPFAVLGGHVLGNEDHLRRTANQLVFFRSLVRDNQGKDCGTVRRSYSDPTLPGLGNHIEGSFKTQLIQVKSHTSLQVMNIDVH